MESHIPDALFILQNIKRPPYGGLLMFLGFINDLAVHNGHFNFDIFDTVGAKCEDII